MFGVSLSDFIDSSQLILIASSIGIGIHQTVAIPKDSRGFQRIPEDSIGFQMIPKDSRGFQRIPEDSKGKR